MSQAAILANDYVALYNEANQLYHGLGNQWIKPPKRDNNELPKISLNKLKRYIKTSCAEKKRRADTAKKVEVINKKKREIFEKTEKAYDDTYNYLISRLDEHPDLTQVYKDVTNTHDNVNKSKTIDNCKNATKKFKGYLNLLDKTEMDNLKTDIFIAAFNKNVKIFDDEAEQ